MTDKRGELGKLADRIRKESSVPVYSYSGALPVERSIYWSEEIDGFLEVAKKAGASLLYLNEDVLGSAEDEPAMLNHVGETAMVHAAFLVDGEFHVFLRAADWLPEEEESPESYGRLPPPGDLEAATKSLRDNKEDFVTNFLEDLHKRTEPVDPSEWSVDQAFRRYLAPKLSTPALRFSPMGISRDGSELDQLIRSLSGRISTTLLSEEQSRVEPLVAECVAWAQKLGIRSLSRSDVEAFLIERKVSTSTEGRRYLWTKAKLAVKVGK